MSIVSSRTKTPYDVIECIVDTYVNGALAGGGLWRRADGVECVDVRRSTKGHLRKVALMARGPLIASTNRINAIL